MAQQNVTVSGVEWSQRPVSIAVTVNELHDKLYRAFLSKAGVPEDAFVALGVWTTCVDEGGSHAWLVNKSIRVATPLEIAAWDGFMAIKKVWGDA